jgi:PPM family protein phosphatase
MLARLRGMMQNLKSIEPTPAQVEPPTPDLLPTWDPPREANGLPQAPPADTASPVEAAAPLTSGEKAGESASPAAALVNSGQSESAGGGKQICPACRAQNPLDQSYCEACGLIFPPEGAPLVRDDDARIRNRYQLIKIAGERGDCRLYEAIDQSDPEATAVAVYLLREPIRTAGADAVEAAAVPVEAAVVETEVDPGAVTTLLRAAPLPTPWPSLAWIRERIEPNPHGLWPRCLAQFDDEGFSYLVLDSACGLGLWDAWDDPGATESLRFGWLIQIAQALQDLHCRGAIVEALRPEGFLILPSGVVRFTDVTQLLPIKLPEHAPLRAGFYSAPELVLASEKVDARADLYAFGAMLYALHLGRELTESDFELQGVPKPILRRFADCHPLFGRLVSKTFCRDANMRFPTLEAAEVDATGFGELLDLLRICQTTLDRVRLEVGAWSSTGMVRTGNEDAFALMQTSRSFEDSIEDHVLLLAADGMGGSDAGEVAARLTVQSLLKKVRNKQPWRQVGADAGEEEIGSEAGELLDSATMRLSLIALISEVNREVFAAAREGNGKRGMGCTLEFVYLAGNAFAIGHVGDSRTYHLHRGQLHQVTEDQTWVQRMVSLGAMTSQEALEHPRRSELQQAIGGQSEVEPAVYEGRLVPGDVILVCSDGVTSHLSPELLQEILLAGTSAEACARQIINWTNLHGGTDNSTALVVRAR